VLIDGISGVGSGEEDSADSVTISFFSSCSSGLVSVFCK